MFILFFFVVGGDLDLYSIPVATLLINTLFYFRMTNVQVFKLWTGLYSSYIVICPICRKVQSGASLLKSLQVLAVFMKKTDSSDAVSKGKRSFHGSSVLTWCLIYETLYCSWGRWDWFLRSTIFDTSWSTNIFIGCLLVN